MIVASRQAGGEMLVLWEVRTIGLRVEAELRNPSSQLRRW